jgi:hypothetical protein
VDWKVNRVPEKDNASVSGAMAGVRIHRPGAIAIYLVLGGAIGLFLYGQNLGRRGHTMKSLFFRGGAIILLLMVSTAAAAEQRIGGLGIPLLLLAIWIYKKEDDAYPRDIARGALPAMWWPPLLVWISVVILVLVAQAVFFPQVWSASP